LTRFIGVLAKAGACPQPPSASAWKVERLVDVAVREAQKGCERNPWQPGPEDHALIHELGLDRFCVYTSKTEQHDAKGPFGGKLPDGLRAAEPDRMALSASAPPNALETAVWQPLANTFKVETEGGWEIGTLGSPSVRLAILDSQEDSEDGEDLPPAPTAGSQHGYTLMHLARQLACPDRKGGRCVARIKARRALGYTDFAPEQPLPKYAAGSHEGGNVGTVNELSLAILTEVLEWRHQGSQGHLILNLSLGWDGELFHDLEVSSVSKMNPDVLSVYNALRFAARSGVLVIAAAGNENAGPTMSNWPLLPAAWEMRRPSWCPLLHRRRLVYSVGGVDWQGVPLPNARHGGRPRRVAYGDHAVADQGGEPTAILTGSSVSTAVVSSIAAVVWHLRPELRPDQVMRLIDHSGDDDRHQPWQADFYEWHWIRPLNWLLRAPQLSQVSLCRAVEQACRPDGAPCHALALALGRDSCNLPHKPPQLGPPSPSLSLAQTYSPVTLPSTATAPCGPDRRYFDFEPGVSKLTTEPCPTRQHDSVQSRRWTYPQPNIIPCPGCSLEPPTASPIDIIASLAPPSAPASPPLTYILQLQVSEEWRQALPSSSKLLPDATLDIDCFEGSAPRLPRMTYRVQFDPTGAGALSIPNISEGASLKGCRAQLNFTVEDGSGNRMSVQNPVVVDP
jgi:hypothetical protein